MAKFSSDLVLKISLLVGEELTFWQVLALEHIVPFSNAGIAGGAQLAPLAWIAFVIAEPVTASSGVITASALFALK